MDRGDRKADCARSRALPAAHYCQPLDRSAGPHVNKKSREQFERRTHHRLLDILEPTRPPSTLPWLDLGWCARRIKSTGRRVTMPKVDVYNTDAEKVDSIALDDAIFGAEVKEHLFHAAVRYHARQAACGTHATKGRAQVSGGGKPVPPEGNRPRSRGNDRALAWRRCCARPAPAEPRSGAQEGQYGRSSLRAQPSHRGKQILTVFDAFALTPRRSRSQP